MPIALLGKNVVLPIRPLETESWPEDLDALVAAPERHPRLFENDAVRMLDPRIRAGDRTPVHTHLWPAAL
jgi:hypothetical protein